MGSSAGCVLPPLGWLLPPEGALVGVVPPLEPPEQAARLRQRQRIMRMQMSFFMLGFSFS